MHRFNINHPNGTARIAAPLVSISFGVLVGAGCATHEETRTPERSAPETARTPAPALQPALSDGQITSVIQVANLGEIEQGRLAQTSATNTAVRDFANMMISDHTEANRTLMELARRLNITAAESDTSRDLTSYTNEDLKKLRTGQGEDFDRAYMDVQVKTHKKVLDLLDSKLIPSATKPELTQFLRDVRGKVAEHLREAERIKQQPPFAQR